MQRQCGNCIYWSVNHQEHAKCKRCGEGRNNFVPRDMRCPVPSCQSVMLYYAKEAYLSCPDCGTEIWPFHMEKSDSKTIRQEFEKQLPCDRSPEVSVGVIGVSGNAKGWTKSKSKTKKKPLNKKSTTQIYKELSAASSGVTVVQGNRHDKILKTP